MTRSYTEIAWPKIEDALRDVINDEFPAVYIGTESDRLVIGRYDETIFINLTDCDTLESTALNEIRQYNIQISMYIKRKNYEKSREIYLDRVDKLKQLLFENRCVSDSYFDLRIDSIEYNQDNEEYKDTAYKANLNVSVKNYLQWS